MNSDESDKKTDPPDDDRTRLAGLPPGPPPAPKPPASDVAGDDDSDRTQFARPMPVPPTPADTEPAQGDGTGGTQPPEQTDAPRPLAAPRSATVIPATASGRDTKVGVGTLVNNNYEITAVLKAGGMGEVYRGVEIGTGDPVAIKSILPELAEDEKVGLLFKREARTLRQLSDDAIVRYYNYVHDRDLDRYFLVMEFIEGVPLSDHIERHGAISVPALRTLLKRLTTGLAKAHAQDVIHRDLSPDNVMLPDGAVDQARLIDFGIAKSNVVKEGTMAGQFAGKFKYVAPEQLGHFGGDIGPGADVYGLALLVAAAALGRPLDMGSSIVEAVQSRQSIPDLSEIPQDLRPILAYMLEPNPADRPQSMDDVRGLLETPRLIPAKYLEGRLPPPPMDPGGRSTSAPMPFQPTQPPPGLQMPMTEPSAYPQTQPPYTQPPQTTPPIPQDTDTSGGRLLMVLALVFVAILGGVGWYAYNEGMIGAAPQAPRLASATPETGATAGLPDPLPETREGFLATFDTGPCTFASRVPSGPRAGMIEGFSTTGDSFAGLPTIYEETFGARPAILPREITQPQCAVLEFARGLQGRGGSSVVMQLSADEIASGETLRADLTVPGDQVVWTVLISPLGAIYNLTERLSEPVGGRRSMNFGLTLASGTEAQPQLLLAVATDRPLARASTALDGAQAAGLLPLVLEEIAAQGAGQSAALSYVLLTPPPEVPPATEEPATDP